MLAERYELTRLVGAGGMGAVYEARQLDLRRRVAVKVVLGRPADGTSDVEALARFRAEALAVAAASHPNVVQIFECRVDHDPPFFAMELLDGETLAGRLRRETRLGIDAAVEIAIQLLGALEAAHGVGVIHRDLKPGNIFLVDNPVYPNLVKLLDFGIAKLADGGPRTRTGDLLGTPSYMAPEQLLGSGVDARTDVHAVGVCLYQMLSGARPYSGTAGEVAVRILREPPLPIDRVVSGLPRELSDIVMRSIEKDPERRFASASAMFAALRDARRPETAPHGAVQAPPARAGTMPGSAEAPRPRATTLRRARPRPLRTVLAVAGLTVVVVGVPGAIAALHYARTPPTAPAASAATSNQAPSEAASGISNLSLDVDADAPPGSVASTSAAPADANGGEAAPRNVTPTLKARDAGGSTRRLGYSVELLLPGNTPMWLGHRNVAALEAVKPEVARCLGPPFVPGDQLDGTIRFMRPDGTPSVKVYWTRDGVPEVMGDCILRAIRQAPLAHEPVPSEFHYSYRL